MARRRYEPTKIREWRKMRGLTLEQLAARVGMTAGNLSRLERGLVPYSQEILEAAADALRCEPVALMSDPPDPIRAEWLQMLDKLPQKAAARALKIIQAYADEEAA